MPAPNIVAQNGFVFDGGAGYSIQQGTALTAIQYSAGVTSYGGLIVSTEGTKPTYSAGSQGFTLPATPTDVVAIYGSSTKTVRILRVGVSGTAATANQGIVVSLLRRSTAVTGGTGVTPTIAQHDSASAAATATVTHYTALGTPGTSAGVVRAAAIMFGLVTSSVGQYSWVYSDHNGQGIVLRGTTQGLVINLNGVALANTTTMTYDIEFTEE